MNSTVVGLVVAFALTVLGLGLMLYGLVVRPLLLWWRTRHFTAPEVSADDEARAREVVSRVAEDAGIAVPRVRVVPWLGKPLPTWSGLFGGGGIAVTKFTPGRPTEIVLAAGATQALSVAALRHLVAHEMGQVALHATRKGRLTHALWLVGFVTFVSLTALGIRALGIPPVLPLILATVGFFAVRMGYMRRAEYEADRFAIRLTRDITGAVELDAAYEEHSPERGN